MLVKSQGSSLGCMHLYLFGYYSHDLILIKDFIPPKTRVSTYEFWEPHKHLAHNMTAMIKTVLNICVQVLCEYKISFHWDKCPGMKGIAVAFLVGFLLLLTP